VVADCSCRGNVRGRSLLVYPLKILLVVSFRYGKFAERLLQFSYLFLSTVGLLPQWTYRLRSPHQTWGHAHLLSGYRLHFSYCSCVCTFERGPDRATVFTGLPNRMHHEVPHPLVY
jgi:hypothetical protein